MDLGESIKNLGNKNTLVTSLLSKTIKDTFRRERDIDISDHIISLSMLENIVLVKTGNPTINGELLLINDIILSECQSVAGNIGVDIEKIKYI